MGTITIHSFKGGTGKTTLAVNLAILLSRTSDELVLLIDSDFQAPSFAEIFDKKADVFFNDFLGGKAELRDIVQSSIRENLDIIFANPRPQFGKGVLSLDKTWHSLALKRLMEKMPEFIMDQNYAYVIIDNCPGVNLAAINTLIISTIGILTLRPTEYAIEGTRYLIENIYAILGKKKGRRDFVLFNQIPHNPEYNNTESERMIKWEAEFLEYGVETIGKLPCFCSVAHTMLDGLTIFPPDHEFISYLTPIVERIMSLE
ncbi:MAG: ParA family protein [Candidatus Hodarchaeota archaeon]